MSVHHQSSASSRIIEDPQTAAQRQAAAKLALRKQCAGLDWNALALGFAAYKDKFLLLTDHEVEAQIAILDLQLTARKAWLKQPANNRQPAVISDLFAAK